MGSTYDVEKILDGGCSEEERARELFRWFMEIDENFLF